MKYNKLVRDKIPAIISRSGGKPKYYQADTLQFQKALKKKLYEEVEELCKAKEANDQMDELADILEVVEALAQAYGLPRCLVQHAKRVKAETRGRFDKRIILKEA